MALEVFHAEGWLKIIQADHAFGDQTTAERFVRGDQYLLLDERSRIVGLNKDFMEELNGISPGAGVAVHAFISQGNVEGVYGGPENSFLVSLDLGVGLIRDVSGVIYSCFAIRQS